METFITQVPSSFAGLFSLFCFTLAGAVWLASTIRKNDLTTLRESNTDLRAALDDMRIEMDAMKIKITDLESKNGTLYNVVERALQKYFAENPEKVKELQHALGMVYVELQNRPPYVEKK